MITALTVMQMPWPAQVSARLAVVGITTIQELRSTDLSSLRIVFDETEPTEARILQQLLHIRQEHNATAGLEDLHGLVTAAQIPAADKVCSRLQIAGIRSIDDLRQASEDDVTAVFPDRHLDVLAMQAASSLLALWADLQPTPSPAAMQSKPNGRPQWAIEVVASRLPASAWQVAQAIHEVFDEPTVIAQRRRLHAHPWLLMSFADRCLASGVPHLAAATTPEARQTASGPQKAMRDADAVLPASDTATSRRHMELAACLHREAAIRILLYKNAGSWRSLASGCHTWAQHRDRHHLPHFPASTDDILAFSTVFRNGDTFANYVAYLKTAHQVQGLPVSWDIDAISALKKGSAKATIKSRKAIFRQTELAQITAQAAAQGHRLSQLVYSIAYSYMLRVQSELFPLQNAAAAIAAPGKPDWHSFITFGMSNNGKATATIHLRKRKNASDPSEILRECICTGDSRRPTCGPCALRLLTAECPAHHPLLINQPAHQLLALLRQHCSLANIPATLPVGWHGFRKGRANDLLAAGTPISTILTAGGWKSPAVLSYLLTDELHRRVAGINAIEGSDSE
jgi:hypothetical protein